MSQRNVEIVIGRLVSDEDLRTRFRANPRGAILQLRERGLDLNAVEAAALESLATPTLERLARELDGRLQRASLAPKRRRRRAALIGALVLLFARVASSEPLSVEAAVAEALEQSPRVKEAGLRVASVREALAEARTRALPTLSVEALGGKTLSAASTTIEAGALGDYPATGPLPATDTKLESSRAASAYVSATAAQPLTQIYSARLGVRAREAALAAEREKLRAERVSVAHDVRRTYYAIVQAESGLAAAIQRAEMLREASRLAGDLVLREVALRSDSLDAQANLAAQEARIASLESARATQREQLNDLLGRDLSTPFELVPLAESAPEPTQLAAAQQRALAARPELREASHNVRALEAQRRIEGAERLPDISLVVSYSSYFGVEALPSNLTQAGVRVRWELLDWGRRRHRIAQARLDVARAKTEQRALRSRVLLDVNASFRALREAALRLTATRLARVAALEKARVALDRQREQMALLADALAANAALSDADDEFQRALLDYWSARADFEKASAEEI